MANRTLKIEHVQVKPYDVGLALRRLRFSAGYSQQHLATSLEISRKAYIDWENNKVNLSIKHCTIICEFYGIKLSTFVIDYLEE